MIQVHIFSNVEKQSKHPRAGHGGDVFELLLLCIRYDPEHFDVQAVGRNKRTGERWSRLFQQEADDRQVGRGVEWLLELVGGDRSGVFRPVAPVPLPDEGWTQPFGVHVEASLSEQVAAALAAAAREEA